MGIHDDGLIEEDEIFEINLLKESKNTIIGSKNKAILTIIDNDNATEYQHNYKSKI